MHAFETHANGETSANVKTSVNVGIKKTAAEVLNEKPIIMYKTIFLPLLS